MQQLHNYYQGKSVLITGGAGFIGSHLTDLLVASGAQITILDNLSTGDLDNIAHLRNKIHFVHGDITNPETCLEVAQNKSHIFHLAAFISVPQSIQEPELCMRINVDGTENMLKAAVTQGVKHFVFSSSSAVYGTQEGVCAESTSPSPQSPYAMSKLMGEKLCQKYAAEFDISTAPLRYFNVYGDRQNPDGAYAAVVAKFNYNLKHGKPLTIFGDGSATRDFIPVSRVALANAIMGMHDGLTGEPVNVATGKSISLLELIAQLERESGYTNAGITFAPERPGDILHSAADCSQFLKLCS